MIEERKIWVCTDCNKVFEHHVGECPECSNAIKDGYVYGSFRVIRRSVTGGRFIVECIPCGYETDVDRTNLRRQKSCGCKPRHINILSVSESAIRYFCSRCRDTKVEEPPIFEWCCNQGEE